MRTILFLAILQFFFYGELMAQTYSGTIHYGQSNIEYQVSLKEWRAK